MYTQLYDYANIFISHYAYRYTCTNIYIIHPAKNLTNAHVLMHPYTNIYACIYIYVYVCLKLYLSFVWTFGVMVLSISLLSFGVLIKKIRKY